MKQIVLVLAMVAAGCDVLSPGTAVHVRIDQAAIRIDPATGSATVPFTVLNQGEAAVYLDRCGERVLAVVDRHENGAWNQVSSDACLTIYDMSPLQLSAGDQRSSARTIHEPGQYRLRIGVSSEPVQATAWATASPAFTVDADGGQ